MLIFLIYLHNSIPPLVGGCYEKLDLAEAVDCNLEKHRLHEEAGNRFQ